MQAASKRKIRLNTTGKQMKQNEKNSKKHLYCFRWVRNWFKDSTKLKKGELKTLIEKVP